MNENSCSLCGQKGKRVKPVTLNSLLEDHAKPRLHKIDGYYLCQTPDCDVSYYNPETHQFFLTPDVKVKIGQKQTGIDRQVCYCFNHTVADIEKEVKANGTSSIPDSIKDNCKKGLDRCEEKNPQGSCCLGNVQKVFKESLARHKGDDDDDDSSSEDDCCAVKPETKVVDKASQKPKTMLAIGGALVAAVLSSACCWLPLLLVAFGASAVGVSSFFEEYRVLLLVITAVLLGAGFYFVYFRKEKCEPGSACATPNVKLSRFNKVSLWLATVLVLGFALFPNYIGNLIGGVDDEKDPHLTITKNQNIMSFDIEGMTCEACAVHIRSNISKVDGVTNFKVSYDRKMAEVVYGSVNKNILEKDVTNAIVNAGYVAKLQKTSK